VVEVGEQFEEQDFDFSDEIKGREAFCVKVFTQIIDQAEKTLVICVT
jgi:hypothetical protein